MSLRTVALVFPCNYHPKLSQKGDELSDRIGKTRKFSGSGATDHLSGVLWGSTPYGFKVC